MSQQTYTPILQSTYLAIIFDFDVEALLEAFVELEELLQKEAIAKSEEWPNSFVKGPRK